MKLVILSLILGTIVNVSFAGSAGVNLSCNQPNLQFVRACDNGRYGVRQGAIADCDGEILDLIHSINLKCIEGEKYPVQSLISYFKKTNNSIKEFVLFESLNGVFDTFDIPANLLYSVENTIKFGKISK